MTRTVGLYGCEPPKNAPAILARDILTGVQPPNHPPAADYLQAMGGGWKMLGNGPAGSAAEAADYAANQVPASGVGNCVSVMFANGRRLITATIGSGEAYPSLQQVVKFYKTQNSDFPNQDEGMDIQTALEECVRNGYADDAKALAFAKVDHNDVDECKAAIAATGCLMVGITVEDVNEQQFRDEHPWGFHANAQDLGRHGVLTGGYTPPHYGSVRGQGALGGDERFLTWAEETSFTDLFWSRRVNQCWMTIWPEHRGNKEFETGVSWPQVEQQYQQITGRPIAA